jgi:Type I restriction-modification system methyltransferase subunit
MHVRDKIPDMNKIGRPLVKVTLDVAMREDMESVYRISACPKDRKNITTYNLARMNMLLHGVKDSEFEIHHGDTLTNDWDFLRETNPAKMPKFDAIVANPPFSYRWEPTEALGEDVRFKGHGLAPKSAADFAFLLHGFHFIKDDGVMAIILPHGVLFRGGAEERIRTKLLKDGHIDTVIGLPANLFYSTGIPVCILVLKKCKKPDDVLFINAAEHFEKGKRQNILLDEHVEKIVETYRDRKEEPRYSRRVEMSEIEKKRLQLKHLTIYQHRRCRTKNRLESDSCKIGRTGKSNQKRHRCA